MLLHVGLPHLPHEIIKFGLQKINSDHRMILFRWQYQFGKTQLLISFTIKTLW